jgi:hypothetical protein
MLTGYSLKCYACDSDKSPACLSKEDDKFVPEESMKKDCPGAESCVTIAVESVCAGTFPFYTSSPIHLSQLRRCFFSPIAFFSVEIQW